MNLLKRKKGFYIMNNLDDDFKLIKEEIKSEFIKNKKEELEMINQMKYINDTTYSNFLLGFIFFIILCFGLIRLIGW